jgi:opacity protein-like surface antigen
MKHLFLALLLSVSLFSFAQQADAKNDAYTSKGSHAISFTGNFSGTHARYQSNYYNSFAMNTRLGYDYFVVNGLSVGVGLLTSTEFAKGNTRSFSMAKFNPEIRTRYYFGLGNKIPYRWLFVEANASLGNRITNPITGLHSSAVAIGGRVGANIQIHNNWFLDLSAGYSQSSSRLSTGGSLNGMAGVSYRFPHKSKK